jgi:hypothetical protein
MAATESAVCEHDGVNLRCSVPNVQSLIRQCWPSRSKSRVCRLGALVAKRSRNRRRVRCVKFKDKYI